MIASRLVKAALDDFRKALSKHGRVETEFDVQEQKQPQSVGVSHLHSNVTVTLIKTGAKKTYDAGTWAVEFEDDLRHGVYGRGG